MPKYFIIFACITLALHIKYTPLCSPPGQSPVISVMYPTGGISADNDAMLADHESARWQLQVLVILLRDS